MARAVAGVTISRACRVHADGELIGFVWNEDENVWRNDRRADRYLTRSEAVESLKALRAERRPT
jgi:hypothetical protein